MTSEMFVWAWLPGRREPVVCGRVWAEGAGHQFQYGRSYLGRSDAIGLYGMPLDNQPIQPPAGMRLHGALRDGLPDAWGQNVILNRLTGTSGPGGDTGDLDDLTYMRESASDRFGAMDFQTSASRYRARQEDATLDDLADAAAAMEAGRPLPPALDAALTHGTTIGGARPKATLIDSNGDGWIAKFSSSSDRGNPTVRNEALALHLARQAGVQTVEFTLTTAAGRDALLVRRFDRGPHGARIMAVSGLTLLRLDELVARYATYPDLLDVLRSHSDAPEEVGPQLFTRIAANIALGNADDHARNHAALWDGQTLTLSPAYDLDPCRTPGWDANQAMAYGRNGERASTLEGLVRTAAVYDLSSTRARHIVDEVVGVIEDNWDESVDRVGLTREQGKALLGSRVLNRGILDDRAGPMPAEEAPRQPGQVWVQAHVRGGHPVAGHWRTLQAHD